MVDIAPRTAAKMLASELGLPSWKGAVLVVHRPDGDVLVVAADAAWLKARKLPGAFCGYSVEADQPWTATGQTVLTSH